MVPKTSPRTPSCVALGASSKRAVSWSQPSKIGSMAEATTIELDAQYRQLREECGLLDRSERGKLLLRGAEAAEYLQGQLTNDVEGLSP
ncbi:MAG TPA: hypothetical protein VFT10_00245, partial [Solirubrobacterales bacterium]|nr:hypothetical protein [Solirubrobacterales bacterium]